MNTTKTTLLLIGFFLFVIIYYASISENSNSNTSIKPTEIPAVSADAIQDCNFENCGTVHLTQNQCQTARCCNVGGIWTVYFDSVSCKQAQAKWTQLNKTSTQYKPVQPIIIQENISQNNSNQNYSDPASDYHNYLRESCQDDWRDYNNCISEYNNEMLVYNTCLNENAANRLGTSKICIKPFGNFCVKPGC